MTPENLSLLKLPKRSLEKRGAASGDLLHHCLRRATRDVRGNPRHKVLPKTGAVSVVNERAPRSPPDLPSPQIRHRCGASSSQPPMARGTVSYAGVLCLGGDLVWENNSKHGNIALGL